MAAQIKLSSLHREKLFGLKDAGATVENDFE
jgi:hypothetical protein